MSYHNSFDLPLVIARPFNTYGPRQSARAVIPTIIIQIACGAEEIKLGDTTPTRDFNYVKDTCKGLLEIANSSITGQVLNIGSNTEISVQDTLNKIKKIMNSDVKFITDAQSTPKKSEVFRLWCDNQKIKNATNFKSEYTIDQGLKETIEWFIQKENLGKYKPENYNV